MYLCHLLQGEAIIFAPARGSTFQKFVDVASSLFKIDKVEKYDDFIWEKHLQVSNCPSVKNILRFVPVNNFEMT
jgi:hypothetical protein